MSIPEVNLAQTEIRVLLLLAMKMSTRDVHEFLSSRGIDITGQQFGILRILSHRQEATLSELSKLFVLDPSTLVPVVDSLERKGFIERGRDPNDRRRIPLNLTQAGIDLLSTVAPIHQDDLLIQALNAMGDEKTQQLLQLLRELLSHMPEGVGTLDDLHAHLNLPLSERCPNKIHGDHV